MVSCNNKPPSCPTTPEFPRNNSFFHAIGIRPGGLGLFFQLHRATGGCLNAESLLQARNRGGRAWYKIRYMSVASTKNETSLMFNVHPKKNCIESWLEESNIAQKKNRPPWSTLTCPNFDGLPRIATEFGQDWSRLTMFFWGKMIFAQTCAPKKRASFCATKKAKLSGSA